MSPRSNVSPTDIYMQFFNMPLDVTGSLYTTMFSAEYNTGLSIRGEYFWLIHKVEFFWLFKALLTAAAYQGVLKACVSTRSGLATMPEPEDAGVVSYSRWFLNFGTTGTYDHKADPITERDFFSPPLPLAAPKLSVYLQGENGSGSAFTWVAGRKLNVRLGITTAPLTSTMYDEIAEAWAYDTY